MNPLHISRDRIVGCGVLGLATAIALVSASDYAGSWNDGSRLATVEALVDQHTLAIDHSIFVDVPKSGRADAPLPYRRDDADLLEHGTLDKLFIDGHYYSDKSPVPALLMAAAYEPLHQLGLQAAKRPDLFCYRMTLVSSGLAYVVAVWCMHRLGRLLGLPVLWQIVFTLSFAVATVAPAYARHTNNHILLLGVAAALALNLAHLAIEVLDGQIRASRLLLLGVLAGLGYTIDLGAGPPLVVCLLGIVLFRCRRLSSVLWVLVGALPWIALHHAVNYAVGGTLKPANAVADYFNWPGCPFNAQNMTGTFNHSISHFLVYGAALLFGKRGFFGHNLALFALLPAGWLLIRRRSKEFPEIVFAAAWFGGTWLAYALTSSNYSGQCCSIRWFVPLLVPGYYGLAVAIRDFPGLRGTFAMLSGWGICLAALMWWQGPWMKHMVPLYWPLQGAALASCLLLQRLGHGRQGRGQTLEVETPGARAA